MSGSTIGPEYDGQIRQTIIAVRQMGRVSTEMDLSAPQRAASRFPDHAVILNAAMGAATHSLTGATSARATVCKWNSGTAGYVETDLEITVYNHSESTAFAVDTFGVARHIDGHYWFFGDCEAMGAR
jgi:hypothetical protein